jgi:hypothetical protein
MSDAIRTEQLSKRYGETLALDSLDLARTLRRLGLVRKAIEGGESLARAAAEPASPIRAT